MGPAKLRVLFATSEITPLVKTGGLADVSAGLPAALVGLGVDVRVLVPGYPQLLRGLRSRRSVGLLSQVPSYYPDCRLLASRVPEGDVGLLAIDCPALYHQEGGPYQDGEGHDWPFNHLRFGLLSSVAARLAGDGSPLAWRPDIVHCNDWQAGLAPAYLHFAAVRRCPSIQTIHNLAFQGIFPARTLQFLGLPAESFNIQGVEYYGSLSFLKAGVFYADKLTTVSPTYAVEIQREPLGMGLQGLLAARASDLTGILNGIDIASWNPGADPYVAEPYGPQSLERKLVNKLSLQHRFGLTQDASIPLFGVVNRLTSQKGVDLLLDIAPELATLPAQLVVLGSGEHRFEDRLRGLAAESPRRVGVHIGFDEPLSHLVTAGADIFLMPSRFEPCGLNQMYAQRYGTPPIVHATGGLADSVAEGAPYGDVAGSGFLFHAPHPQAFLEAIRRALALWREPLAWRSIQRAGMARDFSWEASARRYLQVYNSAIAKASGPSPRDG